jgi:hypothetical protein
LNKLGAEYPTAVQVSPEAHDTPFNWLSMAPAGFGVVLTVQAVPFHDSASVSWTPELSV